MNQDSISFDLGCNFDYKLFDFVDQYDKKHAITSFFGKLKRDGLPGGRTASIIPDFTLDPVTGIDGFTDSALLPGCVRLFPHKAKAEGHFVARLKKSADAAAGTPRAAVPARSKKTETLPGDMDEFLKKTSFRPDPDRIVVENEYVSLLPEIPSLPKLRYLRTGLLLGQLKNGRFRPSQALAMFLTKEQWQDPVDLSRNDPDVIRYLKGETVNADREDTKGFRLLCVDGYPLGFVKQDRSRLKNMYLPGWRMQ